MNKRNICWIINKYYEIINNIMIRMWFNMGINIRDNYMIEKV